METRDRLPEAVQASFAHLRIGHPRAELSAGGSGLCVRPRAGDAATGCSRAD